MPSVQSSVANFSLKSTYTIAWSAGGYYYLTSNPTTGMATKRYSWSVPAGSSLVSAILTNTTSGDSGSKSIGGVTRADTMDFTSAVQSVWGNGYIDLGYRFTCIANLVSPPGTKTETCNFNNGLMTISYTPPTAATLSNVLLDSSASNPYRGAGAGMTLSWSAANGTNNNISSYAIYYRDNGGSWALYASGITSGSYTVYAHPTAGNNRQFYVVAIAPYGNSGNITSPTAYSYSAVGVPTNVSITPVEVFPDASLTLSWSAATAGVGTTVTGYQVIENGVVKTTVTGTSYVFSAPVAGAYIYKVVAVASVSGYNSAQSAGVALAVKQPASLVVLDGSTISMDGLSVITATITPQDPAYTHLVTFALDATRKDTFTLAAGTVTKAYTIPAAWCIGLPNASGGTASCTVQTKNGAVVIGSMSQEFAVTVPATVLPTVSLAVAPVNGFGSIYLKGKSSVKLSSTAAGASGSTIASQSLFGGGYSGSASPFTTGVLNTVGSNVMTATVTDTRNRQKTATQTITVVDYASPVIFLVTAFRSNGSGAPVETGEYVAIKASLSVSDVPGNTGTATVKTRVAGGSWGSAETFTHNTSKILSGILVDNAYEVMITLTDTVGTVSTYSIDIRPARFMFDFRMDRAGIGQLAGETKTLTLPIDWTTNINADLLDGQHASSFAPANHNQSADTITTGVLALVRGGTGVTTAAEIALLAYPIGAIYISTGSTSPATLFGGTWAAIAARFLLGAGGSFGAGNTGGSETHTLTTQEIAAHSHRQQRYDWNGIIADAWGPLSEASSGGNQGGHIPSGGQDYGMSWTWKTNLGALFTQNSGSGSAHNNMPPYLVVYMWKRTA